MQTKLSRFFQRIFGVCSRLLQDKNVYEPNFATFLVISIFDILLNVIDDFHFCCFILFVGCYLIKYTRYLYHIYVFFGLKVAGAVFNMIFLRFGKRWEPQKEEEVQRLQNQVFHIFLGPMGLGETLAIFPQTVCLTLGVLTVIVKGRVPRSRCRTDFVAIFVLSCLHVRFVWIYVLSGGARPAWTAFVCKFT